MTNKDRQFFYALHWGTTIQKAKNDFRKMERTRKQSPIPLTAPLISTTTILRALRTKARQLGSLDAFMGWSVDCMGNGSNMPKLFVELFGPKTGHDFTLIYKELTQ